MRALPGERSEPLRLGVADQREAQQDVVEPRVGEHLGLAELLARDPSRAGIDLEPRDLRKLVRLDVWPKRDAVLVAVRLHGGDVPLDSVEIGDEHRRLELVEPHHSPVGPCAPLRAAADARAACSAIQSSSESVRGAERPTSSLPSATTAAPASR